MVRYNSGAITLANQWLKLEQTYKKIIKTNKPSMARGELSFVITLRPTPESMDYKVLVKYKLNKQPSARLVSPKKIAKFDGEKPHHLYNREKDGDEELCVYDPKGNEWRSSMFLADSYIPWVVTWLSAYEIWQITGKWVYPERVDSKPKQNI